MTDPEPSARRRARRPSRLRALLALALCLGAAGNAGAGGPADARADPGRVRFVAVGDSITAGIGATEPSEGGFVTRLARRFPELDFVNGGCNGATTRDWTSADPQLPPHSCRLGNAWERLAAPALPAQVFHVMLGTNDLMGHFESPPLSAELHGRVVPPEEYERRLRELIARMDALVLLSVPPLAPSMAVPQYTEPMTAYRAVVLRIVDENPDVVLGGDFLTLLGAPEMDHVHPNDAGHERIAEVIAARLLALLPNAGSAGERPITPATVAWIRGDLRRQLAASQPPADP